MSAVLITVSKDKRIIMKISIEFSPLSPNNTRNKLNNILRNSLAKTKSKNKEVKLLILS
jgi:hypothetical protein